MLLFNNGETTKKQYSYLIIPHGLETNYREVQTIAPDSQKWTIYCCLRSDCVDSEKYVAIRQYTHDRLTADTLERIISNVWNWEYF